MKTYKKILAAAMAAVMTVSAIGITALAEDEYVKTYTDENGETITITQADLDAGHWDKDALGDEIPAVYEDFPAQMNPSVDDYANLSIKVRYMKTLTDSDSAVFTLTDLDTGEDVYSEKLGSSCINTGKLPMDKYYLVKITEQFDGQEPVEYSKYIQTQYAPADMPDYVLNPSPDGDETISIMDTAKLDEGTTVDEDGVTHIDTDIASCTNVPESEWQEYKKTLESNKLYNVTVGYGRDSKIGFISTYDWGEELGIFTPEYNVSSSDPRIMPIASTFDPSNISEGAITGCNEYEMGHEFYSTTNNYTCWRYTINKDGLSIDGNKDLLLEININNADGIYLQIWHKRVGDSKVNRVKDAIRAGTGNCCVKTALVNGGEDLTTGDTLYFMIYGTTTASRLKGSICIEWISWLGDDVVSSAYTQYKNNNSIPVAAYTDSKTIKELKESVARSYIMNDYYDVDTFYLDNNKTSGDYDLYYTNTGLINLKESDIQNPPYCQDCITVYYVDFSSDSHFILNRVGTYYASNTKGETVVHVTSKNANTKYFFEVYQNDYDRYEKAGYTFSTVCFN